MITNNRYIDSVDSENASKKDQKVSSEEQEKPKAVEQKQKPSEKTKSNKDPRQRFSMIQHRVSPTIEPAKRKVIPSRPKKAENKKQDITKEEIKEDEPKEETEIVQEEKQKSARESSGKSKKSDSVHNSQYREDRSRIQSIKIQEINHSRIEVAHEGERITKIELNLENSEDDIDFVGYGTIRVSNKKDTSRSPSEIKQSFTRISPARDIAATMKGDDRMTTRPFTPVTSEKKSGGRQVITTSTITERHISGHQATSHAHNKSSNNRRIQQDDREEEVILY